MSVDECIVAYTKLADRTFGNLDAETNWNNRKRSLMSSQMNLAVQELLEDRGLGRDELLKDTRPGCKVYV